MPDNLDEVRAPLDKVEFLVERYGWAMADHGAADGPEASTHFEKALSLKRDLLAAVEGAVAKAKLEGFDSALSIWALYYNEGDIDYDPVVESSALREQYEEEGDE